VAAEEALKPDDEDEVAILCGVQLLGVVGNSSGGPFP
jgi:hypothetical protein